MKKYVITYNKKNNFNPKSIVCFIHSNSEKEALELYKKSFYYQSTKGARYTDAKLF